MPADYATHDNDDIIWGVPAIAEHVKRSQRQTYYGLQTGLIPGFKLGSHWGLRPATWRKRIEQQEQRAIASSNQEAV